MLHALLLAAALVAAATPLDTRHAALLDALSSDHGGMSCTPAELRTAAGDATIQNVGRVDGDDVVVAHLNGGCLCGAHNCPVYALRLTAAKPRILMTTFGYGVSMRADSPLPRIVVRAHDSALISSEETYAYRGGRYADVENARVRGDTGARKADVAVRFAPGASSAQLHGSAARDWYDAYTYGAEKGQQLLVDGVRSPADVRFVLVLGDRGFDGFRAGKPFTLPATGTYQLQVAIDKDQAIPYSLTLAIGNNLRSSAPRLRAAAVALPRTPDAALLAWVRSIPAVRCFPSVFAAWTDAKSATGVVLTRITPKQFAATYSPHDAPPAVAGGGGHDSYGAGRVASTGAAVFDKGGPEEDSYLAVLAGTPAPSQPVAAVRAAPRLGGGLGLGSARATVEAALGAARSESACGFEAVHYGPRPQPASEADVWFFYRAGVVVGFVHWEAV